MLSSSSSPFSSLFFVFVCSQMIFVLSLSSSSSSSFFGFTTTTTTALGVAAEVIETHGIEITIDRKFDVRQCLTETDVLKFTELTPKELARIKQNTKDILDGSFQKYTTSSVSFDFYANQQSVHQIEETKHSKGQAFSGKIVLDTGFWPTIKLSSMVLGILLHDVLGYPVEMWQIPFTLNQTPFDRLAVGATHIYVQWWQSDDTGEFDRFVRQSQQVVDAGVQGYLGQYGLYVPGYMQKLDQRINHWRSLLDSETTKHFQEFDPDNYNLPNKKGRKAIVNSFSCKETFCKNGFYIPPQCKKNPKECHELLVPEVDYAYGVMEQLVNNLNLPFVVVFAGEDEMWKLVARRMENHEPVLFLYWVPDLDRDKYLRISLPDYYPECYADRVYGPEGKIDCDFPPNFMQMLAWNKAAVEIPSAFELLRRHEINDLQLERMRKHFVELQDTHPGKTNEWEASCDWIRNSSEIWAPWIPVPLPPQREDIDSWVVVVICIIAGFCIGFGILMAGLVCYFRSRTIVKFSEPVFLYFMIIGSILASVGVIVNVVPSPVVDASCNVTVWLICLGFTLFFGSLFSKTLRLVWIFFQMEKVSSQHFLFNKRHLLFIIAGLLSIDCLILGLWSGLDGLEATEVYDDTDPLSFSVLCRSKHDTVFIGVLAAYKCVLIGITAVFAFLARNLPNVLNESYCISLSVYNVALFTSIILPVSAVLFDDAEASLIVRCIGILLCGFASVALLVLPKMWVIFKGLHGASSNDAIMQNMKVSKGSRVVSSGKQSGGNGSSRASSSTG